MDTNYLQELNKEQLDAVKNYKGSSLIIAGAGSGKTRVLTYRIAYMLGQGIPAYKILALTFTNKAAKEMKERISSLVGKTTASHLWMGTFHSIFAKILRFEAEALGYKPNFTIYDTADTKSVLNSVIKEMNLDTQVYKVNEVYSKISLAKNALITPNGYLANAQMIEQDKQSRKPLVGEIYKRYAKKCFAANAMDFDDLLMNTNILFRDHPAVLTKYQEKFNFILVDEYQDTNFSQYLIIKKLSDQYKNICVVGDDSQSIYSFRGAKIQNILNFKSDYPDYALYKLERNYRSSKNIVNAANSLIEKNTNRIPKNIFSENEDGSKIKVLKSYTDTEESYIVANELIESKFNNKFNYVDFAILYRTNAQSRVFEEAFRKRNIPYKIYGGLSFYQRKEIKDIISYFRLIINQNDEEAFKRVINYPKRGIGDTTLEKINSYVVATGNDSWNALEKIDTINFGFNRGTVLKLKSFFGLISDLTLQVSTLNAYDFANEVISKAGIHKELYTDQTPEGVSRYENVQELLNGIREFCENYFDEGIPTLDKYLENVSLLTDADGEKEEDRDKVTLMTIHSAKGLEYEHVFIVGAEENLFPSQRSSSSLQDLEEERRLFYVAVTRAKKIASISYATSRFRYGSFESSIPSRFIREINNDYLILPEDDAFAYEKPMDKSQKNKYISNQQFKPKEPFIQNKFKKVSETKTSTVSANNLDIEIGMKVEHERFGIGVVINIEGSDPNTKAIVDFKEAGTKNLLLKFARLKIVLD
ncbi:MAG TPA: ATP-dependent DNA helicase [Bacteroidales bacterium]|nr:MAG: ATP-dependent DNA helicase [Bacteroidetes bacterium GWF2_33_38]OFY76249.1 MAG: ATP-dependent DNA helicase [Bacteroidetes bacterium RIFOXYA12_FULL_33_9]HBF87422.1 ATP-dependent DNA helicase [Bacteroidales bacterium]